MDAKEELIQMRREAYQEQEKELTSNFKQLSLNRRIEVVMLSRKLLEDEKSDALLEFWQAYKQLNAEGRALALAYLEAIAANPKYRKK